MLHALRFRASEANRSGTVPLFLALGINSFGAGMFFPFAMLYYQAATDLPLSTIGLALTSATLATLAVGPVTGILVDRYGARRMVIASYLVEAAGFTLYLTVSSVQSLVVAAVLATAGARMFFASSATLIAGMVDDAQRDRWYGLVGITQNAGASLSGLTASLLLGSVGMTGFRFLIGVNVVCLLAAAALILKLKPGRHAGRAAQAAGGYRTILRDRPFMKLVGANFLFVLCSMVMAIGLIVYATETLGAPIWAFGVIGVIQTLLVILLQLRVITVISSIPRTRVMMLAGGIWIGVFLMLAAGVLMPQPVVVPYLLLISITFAIGTMCYMPTARALAAGSGPAPVQGRYIATYEFSWGLAAAAGPVTFGTLFGMAAPLPWLVAAGLISMGILLLARMKP